ncbi:hypothetical protein G4V62_00265 [Bacillaceae bacterium SIJ1]|uniref:hypothetical protein n=1 Tax=Litoribacterium kuwaitense TaxID=1398745 RepID=UPI0013EA6387|nr:hypothetical protein [Litoribacterium kuwaitense]NGP43474.1 hypothetical protein [Litoribacterium kuwaitense]
MIDKNRTRKLVTGLILVFVTLAVGCSNDSNDRKEAIKTVLTTQLTVPNEELQHILEDPIGPEANTELTQFYEENYKAFFTKSGYEEFTRTYASYFDGFVSRHNYRTEVEEVAVSEHDMIKNGYDFSVSLAYEGDGEKGVAKVIGVAHLDDEGKIARMRYVKDEMFDMLRSK